MIVILSSATYLTAYYLFGLRFGFYKTDYPFNVDNVLNYLIPITINIICFEYIRYALLSYESKIINTLVFITAIILEILMVSSLTNISSFNKFMDVVALTFIPAIVSNVLYTYVCKNYGHLPNIIFRLMITLNLYIIPVVPAIPESLFVLIKLFVPLLVLFIVKLLYEKKEKVALKKKDTWAYILYGIAFAFVLSMTMVFSCQFTYGAIVIATESMTGELNVGDVVLYKEYSGEKIEEQEIIIFKENNVLVVHRVVEIVNIDGETRYYTKGDFNLDRDAGYRVDGNIVGKTIMKCPYVGYVTLWLNEMFNE